MIWSDYFEPATFRFVAQCLNHCATAVSDTSLANTDNRNSVHRKSAFSLVTVPAYLSPLHSLTDSVEVDPHLNHTIRPPNRVTERFQPLLLFISPFWSSIK